MGGETGGNHCVQSVEELSTINSKHWSAGPSMAHSRSDTAVVVYDHSIYMLGGVESPLSGSLLEHADLQVFDGTKWTTGTAMGTHRMHHAAVIFGGKIWVIGGKAP